MKKDTTIIRKLAVVAIILVVVTISIIAFVGVYTKNLNKLSNIVIDNTYSTEFEGNREFKLVLDNSSQQKDVYINSEGKNCGEVITKEAENAEGEETATAEKTEIEGYTIENKLIKSNEDSVLNQDSYKKSKKIIENRLEKLGASQYAIRLDEVTGNIIVELPDNDDTNFLYNEMVQKGEFTVIDSQTGLILMDNSDLKNAVVGGTNGQNGYTVYLQLNFNKEGTQKLKDISNNYRETTVETPATESPEGAENTEPKTETKYIEVKIDGTTIKKTYFAEEFGQGLLQIVLLQESTNNDEIQETIKSANAIATLLNYDAMPNLYTLENDNFLKSAIKDSTINIIRILQYSILVVMAVIFIVKFKLNGLIAGILNVGYLAVVELAIKYTNVVLTISGLITIFGVMLINFGFLYILLNKLSKNVEPKDAYKDSMKKLYLSIIPVCIVAVVFTFMQNASVMGIGMILFWGIIVQALYNILFTRAVYVLKK